MSARRFRVYSKLQMAAHRVKKMADRKLMDAAGVSAAQAAVLAMVEKSGQATQKQVAVALGLNESAMTAMINRLLNQGLIERKRDEVDNRVWCLQLSAKGRNAIRAAEEPFDAVNAKIDAILNEGELRDLAAALDKLYWEFKEEPK